MSGLQYSNNGLCNCGRILMNPDGLELRERTDCACGAIYFVASQNIHISVGDGMINPKVWAHNTLANHLRLFAVNAKTYSDGDSMANAINTAADELDRLYLDTTPLTREQLEEVLKENGWESERREHHFNRGTELASTNNWWLTVIDTARSEYELQAPLSAVTRQLLKACGVIQ